ncbi:MAG: NYN domain-containing protein [Deltaproteobacteria bacterium]|jgi:predicted RNA-binding protein with PIN domain|nr:NYN domain-containing protein [Deltaproteobacteria bacterium]
MSIHIIIDGYNLIRQSKSFSDLDRQDIQLGREALLDTLGAYQRIKRHIITVVFDGTNAPHFYQHEDRVKGIRVKFSRSGKSADSLIKRMVNREREKALVVSSDLDVINFAATKGAATIGSSDFEEKIAMSVYMDTKGVEIEDEGGWVPTTKKKGPGKRLSKRKRRNWIKIKKL